MSVLGRATGLLLGSRILGMTAPVQETGAIVRRVTEPIDPPLDPL
jgi:hypothetical protein